MNSLSNAHGKDCGVQMLDRDHEAISEVLLELGYYSARGANPEYQRHMLKRLSRLAVIHFSLEEGMMSVMGYPGLTGHVRRHRQMIEQIRKLSANPNEILTRSLQPAGLLWEGHVLHVENEDLSFGRWLDGSRDARDPRKAKKFDA